MRIVAGAFALLPLLLVAAPAAAQQERAGSARAEMEQVIERSGVVPAVEALGAALGPELERTAEQLAATLNAVVSRLAADPELRASALRAARGAVDVAEVAVVEQAGALQEALKAAAERLEAIAKAREQRK
jgi:hypothetical protein